MRRAVRAAHSSLVYTVRPGDHLGKIAARFGVDCQSLLFANPDLSDHPDLIHPGELIVIPTVGGA